MDIVISAIGIPLGYMMGWCYALLHNYGAAIVLFTLLTKVILFPVSIWVQKNSIIMVRIMPEMNRIKVNYFGDPDHIAEEQQALYKREHYHPLASIVPMLVQLVLLMGVIGAVQDLLGGSDSILTIIPAQAGGMTFLMPVAAGTASLFLALAQSKISPLQREQTISEQVVTGAVSVGISLALGGFVPLGVGIYWISSNLFSILQQLVLNIVVNPRKYIDYQALESSRQDLADIYKLGSRASAEDRRREKADYKRFFSIANKHLVFYSEKSGFYKYYQSVIEYLLSHSNIVIHYVTSDPQDAIFQLTQIEPRIKPYYVGEKKLITLMMKMDADIVVMTTPDLDNYYLKRSYVRKDIEYIYMFHGLTSFLMVGHTGCLNHYDTIFCIGQHQVDELRYEEQLYQLSPRRLVECGYGLLDQITALCERLPPRTVGPPQILIAPSWQPENIMDSCIDRILNAIICSQYHVIVRPHPEYIKRYPGKIKQFLARYSEKLGPELEIQTDFSQNDTVYQSDLLITDWSSIAYEFSYATKRPSLFINTPMKVLNPDYTKYPMQPLDIALRTKIGQEVELSELQQIRTHVDHMLADRESYHAQITQVVSQYVYNIGHSDQLGAQYIIRTLKEKQVNRHVSVKEVKQ